MKTGSIFSFLIFLSSLWLTLPINNPKKNQITENQWTHSAFFDQKEFEELIIEPTEPDNKKKKSNLFLINFINQDLFYILINFKSTAIEALINPITLDFLLNYVQGFCLSPPR